MKVELHRQVLVKSRWYLFSGGCSFVLILKFSSFQALFHLYLLAVYRLNMLVNKMFRSIICSKFHTPLFAGIRSMGYAPKADCDSPKIAVVLSGAGYLDGSEIHESVSVLSHITRNGAVAHCFAPDKKQYEVVNHATQELDNCHPRNMVQEASRIARHPVQDICKLIERHDCFSGLIFPGGFGVAKNLSSFAIDGVNMTILPEIEEVIKIFHKDKKPIGFICISPILAAKMFPCVIITLGKNDPCKWPYRDVILQAKEMGARVESRNWDEVSVDKDNNIYSTPAYMYDGDYHEIDDGIGNLVRNVMSHVCRNQKNKK